MRRRAWLSLFVLALAGLPATSQSVEFNRDIRPILSEYCFTCHGPDTAKRKAGLRLDTGEGAFADLGDKRFVLVPGKAAESDLFKRITAKDRKRMPPASTGKEMPAAKIELIRRWIE